MGKIIYFFSPLDSSKQKTIESNKTIGEVLIDLGIQDLSLAITINGVNPDECDLSYEIQDGDVIEIHRIVHGNSAKGKSTLATIVQIAALVVSIWFPPAAMYVLAAGALVSGALNYQANKLRMQELTKSGSDQAELDTSSNSYSLTNLNNEAKPLQPVPLVMGSHRMAPDIMTNAFKSVMNDQNTAGEVAPIVSSFIPGITADNGAEAVGSSWIPMPANWIAPGFPQYAIKIAPYFWGIEKGNLTPEDGLMVLQAVKSEYLAKGANPSRINFFHYTSLSGTTIPLVIFHSSPADPYYRRYNLFHYIARPYEYPVGSGPNAFGYGNLSHLFAGSHSGGDDGDYLFFNSALGVSSKDIIKVGNLGYYPNTVVSGDFTVNVLSKTGTFLLNTVNGGSYASVKTDSYAVQYQVQSFAITSVIQEGIDFATQTFNYGIGDLTISDRRVGSTEVLNNGNLCAYSPVDKSDWMIPQIIDPSFPVDPQFYTEVHVADNKKLSNIDSPTTLTPGSDQSQLNWIYYDGAIGEDIISFVIAGRVYGTSTSTGFVSNSCLIEVQYKLASETFWQVADDLGVLTIQNNNSKTINVKHFISRSAFNDRIQLRIRKVTLDSANNNDNKVCDLYLTKLCSFRSPSYYFGNGPQGVKEREDKAPFNMEGLYITALVTDASQTNKFSAMVESKCWVFDFENETWSWDYNRNPAFWFLFFAKGGFKNLMSTGAFLYPYSPTVGWQNYPGHPDNTEHIFGAGLTFDQIDMDKVLEWAQFCEDRELYMDMVLKDDTSCAEVLERISNVGRGSVTYYNGKLSVVYEDPEQVPTCLFGMGNILAGSFSVDYAVSDPVKKVIATYTDRTDWESKQVEAIVPYAVDENLKTVEINLEGITETAQAQREVNILAARQYFQRRTYTWDVDIEGLIARRGDLVYLSHDATQYGFSGRIKNFLINAGNITGIETISILDSTITHVTVRDPKGNLSSYECHISGNNIIFDEAYPIEKAPFYIDKNTENPLSDIPQSIPEDYVFIAGAKATPGKLVRISEITVNEDLTFSLTAVDEDPAMWAYEYDNVIPSESFEDAEVSLVVEDIGVKYLTAGLVQLFWSGINLEMVTIINLDTGLPLEANGSYSFADGQVTLELTPGYKYDLEIRPFAIGTPFRSVNKRVTVWAPN